MTRWNFGGKRKWCKPETEKGCRRYRVRFRRMHGISIGGVVVCGVVRDGGRERYWSAISRSSVALTREAASSFPSWNRPALTAMPSQA